MSTPAAAREKAFADVGAVEEFAEGRARLVEVAGRSVGVVKWRGEVFALLNVCPHQRGPVCAGRTMPLLVGDDRSMDVDADRMVVVCPWHGWEFDVRDGMAVCSGARHRVRTFEAKVRQGRVLVEMGPPRRR